MLERDENKARTKEISATSRVSVKIKDNFYTVEYAETKTVPADSNIELERDYLWDTVHKQVDLQVKEIIELGRKK